MKIGIIGSGEMGGNLAKLWAKAGHQVLLSSRHPQQLQGLVDEIGKNASSGTVKDAEEFGDVILLAVNFPSLDEALQTLGDLSGKIVIDITNPVAWDEKNERLIQLLPKDVSAASKLKGKKPGAKIVKAYSHIPSQYLVSDSNRQGAERIAVFYCGDDADAKSIASRLIADSGFAPFDLGDLSRAVEMEIPGPLAFKVVPIGSAEHLVQGIRGRKGAAA